MDKFKAFLARFREPSTWAAIAALGAVVHANPDTLTHISTAGPAVAALLGVFLPEATAPAAAQ
ncbi:hypothetical protein SAMN02745857_03791 [Andreprevotia lacus DSM 23236]|jgi:hypothetical protein|uniref:Uncharacterized protein n=1 Tax=Andreprevotia lacus DSM 23236 TaxID=1121001 RepID=A0A1W1Y0Q6_9NEIS|nr:hypothetical protein [Andreprevotia lacus]SMC29371.1 hypothetical protein SAMN02745857_03791 [Andreprevotia lacus DSM 23236]